MNILSAGHETSAPSNSLSLIEAGGSGWELALVTPQNNNNNNNNPRPVIATKLVSLSFEYKLDFSIPTHMLPMFTGRRIRQSSTRQSLRRRYSKKTDSVNKRRLRIWSHGYTRSTSFIEPKPVRGATRSFRNVKQHGSTNQCSNGNATTTNDDDE